LDECETTKMEKGRPHALEVGKEEKEAPEANG